MSAQLQVTHTSHVTEDQIDHLGHMNVRFYGINATAGTHTMLEERGVPAGTPIVDIHTRHHHEQMRGNALEVRSGLVEVGRNLAIYHELRNAADDDLAASFVHVLDHARLEAPVVAIPEHGRPRSLDLATDPVSSAPSLEVLQQLGLESRAPRVVDDEIMAETGVGLIWGGPPPEEHESDWIRQGPNGERMGWATMESRLRFNRHPTLGARIQSFGATTAIERKTTRSTMWAYDLAEGDVLVAFEVINLAFDINSRRSMLIPDDYLASEQRRFHPEFAPR
ncbi:MAG: acyl-CoA thioesterase FadM [Candidatus Aldehydirespiratoraceae bacterium]|jgi:acyl-CoA thioesterase FadM